MGRELAASSPTIQPPGLRLQNSVYPVALFSATGTLDENNYQLSLTDPRDKIVLWTELDELCDKIN